VTRSTHQFPNITTVLFDLDDTLLDSFPARVEALEYVFKCAGMSQVDVGQELQRFRGVEIKDILTQFGATKRN